MCCLSDHLLDEGAALLSGATVEVLEDWPPCLRAAMVDMERPPLAPGPVAVIYDPGRYMLALGGSRHAPEILSATLAHDIHAFVVGVRKHALARWAKPEGERAQSWFASGLWGGPMLSQSEARRLRQLHSWSVKMHQAMEVLVAVTQRDAQLEALRRGSELDEDALIRWASGARPGGFDA